MKERITIIGAGNLTMSILEAIRRSRAKFTINVVDIDKKKSSQLKKFGVKSIKVLQHAALGPLSYIKSTPRQWFLGFDGEEVKLTSKELTNQQLQEKLQLSRLVKHHHV